MDFFKIVEIVAETSKCTRLKVGCVLVKDKRILATGYNGTIPGYPNECEENGITKDTVLHAEENVLLQALKYQTDIKDSELYINYRPCNRCLRLLIAAGISKIHYKHEFREPVNIQTNILIKYE